MSSVWCALGGVGGAEEDEVGGATADEEEPSPGFFASSPIILKQLILNYELLQHQRRSIRFRLLEGSSSEKGRKASRKEDGGIVARDLLSFSPSPSPPYVAYRSLPPA